MLAKDDDGCRSLTFLFVEGAPADGADTEHVEIVFGYVFALDEFGVAATCEGKLASARKRRHAFETLRLRSIVKIIRIRNRRPQPYQTILFPHDRYWANEHDIHEAEDRCVQ